MSPLDWLHAIGHANNPASSFGIDTLTLSSHCVWPAGIDAIPSQVSFIVIVRTVI